MVDTVTGRRFRRSPAWLAAYVAGAPNGAGDDDAAWKEAIQSSSDREHLVPGWQHWYKRSWYPSDQCYVASRRRHADTDDPDGPIPAAAVERLLASEGPPPEERMPDGERTRLGPPEPPSGESLAALLVSRRTERVYRAEPPTLSVLSGLLWFGFADIRTRRERAPSSQPGSHLDSYGSAWDVYVCVFATADLASGVYRYDLRQHELIAVRLGNYRKEMLDVMQGQHPPDTAAWTLGLVADFPRYQWRHRNDHGLRRLYIEAGHIGQDLVVLGQSYGLGTMITPAQKDRAYLDLHGIDCARYAPIYTLTMGRSKRGTSPLRDLASEAVLPVQSAHMTSHE